MSWNSLDKTTQRDGWLYCAIFSHTLSPTPHVTAVLTQCNQRLYLLSQFKYQNLSAQALDTIFLALILSRITYALPAFAGHISITAKNKINKFFCKAYRRSLVSQMFHIDFLINKSHHQLLKSIQHPDHCQHNLLPGKRSCSQSRQ